MHIHFYVQRLETMIQKLRVELTDAVKNQKGQEIEKTLPQFEKALKPNKRQKADNDLVTKAKSQLEAYQKKEGI